VGQFSHHCKLTNNCVGKKNKELFLLFLFTLLVLLSTSAFALLNSLQTGTEPMDQITDYIGFDTSLLLTIVQVVFLSLSLIFLLLVLVSFGSLAY